MYYDQMATLKRNPFVDLVLLLAILLQGVVPFLHAHTGVSTVTGIHAPEAQLIDYSATKRLSFEHLSKTDEESSVVKVGAGRSNEDSELATHLISPSASLADVPAKVAVVRQIGVGPQIFVWQGAPLYDSEKYPPPALAPPTQTL